MACNVRIESYKRFEQDTSVLIPMGSLQIRLRRRYQLKFLQTSTNDSKYEKLRLLDERVSPESVKVLNFPRYVLDSPKYVKLDIVDMLEKLELDSYICDFLSPMMESFVMDASTSFGAENFVVLAHVEVVKTEVTGGETAAHSDIDSESKLKTD